MVTRISDIRVSSPDPELALQVDLLMACHSGSDIKFMFAALERASPETWRIPVDPERALLFEWIEAFGAINIRLE